MQLAETKVYFQRLLDCGGGELYEEKLLRRWWGNEEAHPLSTIIAAQHIALSRVIWVCLHLPVPPLMALHRASHEAATELLERARKESVHIDLRSAFALKKKGEWNDGRISLGELRDARRRALTAISDLAELGADRRCVTLAKAFHEASSDEPETALRNFHYTIEEDPLAEKGNLPRNKMLDVFRREEVIV